MNTNDIETRETFKLAFTWKTSRGAGTYGYPLCVLKVNGKKVAQALGGGYSLQSACVAKWLKKIGEVRAASIITHSGFNWETAIALDPAFEMKDHYLKKGDSYELHTLYKNQD